jgi:hypothetical protein
VNNSCVLKVLEVAGLVALGLIELIGVLVRGLGQIREVPSGRFGNQRLRSCSRIKSSLLIEVTLRWISEQLIS